MAAINLRVGASTVLSNQQVDNNFQNLNNALGAAGSTTIPIPSGTGVPLLSISPTTSGTFTAANILYSGTLTGSTAIMAIGTNQIYKDVSGNVGLGLTPSGTYKLEVSGSVSCTSQLRSSVVTGTAPLIVASTTPVANLCAATVTTIPNLTGMITSVGNATTVVTNANLTGMVTSVGNAASLGSFTSLQLLTALSEKTGTGSNVFATSPTFVSPVLGTPTSGNLTNCTFPTVPLAAGLVTTNSYTVTSLTSTGTQLFGPSVGTFAGFNYLGAQQSWQRDIGTPIMYLSLSDAAGNNGGSYNYYIRGVDTNGTASVNIASINLNANTTACAGAITATGNITAYYSDDRLKTRLGNIPNALEKVLSLNGFYYEANETAQALGYAVSKEAGVSAQEVQAVLPEIVVPAPIDDKYLTVHYERLIPLLIEAIKELKMEIDILKGK